jgi:hypothetical protein
MSIQRIDANNTEFFTIETNPSKSYSSRLAHDSAGALIWFTGSGGALEETLDNTGSVNIFSVRSPIEKETLPLGPTSRIAYEDQGFEQLRLGILENTSSNITPHMSGYLSAVNETSQSIRKQAKVEIIRFIPTFNLSTNSVRKNLIREHLMPYYRSEYPSAHYGYTNYHSLNFFTSGSDTTQYPHPNNSALLYPNPSGSLISAGVFDSAFGLKSGEPLSIDFWINPRFTVDEGADYKAGTVLHLTSAYAVSIHSGSSVDINGRPDKFRVMVQFGSGSGLPPSQDIVNVDVPGTGVFMSTDNSLDVNKWSHVTVRYGGTNFNNGSGSFIINGENKGNFSFDSPGFGLFDTTEGLSPCVLAVGNFYEGENLLAQFFNANHAARDGVLELVGGTTEPVEGNFSFNHPLNAEIHDLKIYNKYLTLPEIAELDTAAPQNLDNLKFYVPPFFTSESPRRTFVGEFGGEIITPFFERDGETNTPFAADFAFGAGGHYPNLENYTREFVTGRFPRLYYLTGSSFEPGNSVVQTANAYMYTSGTNAGGVKKRLYTVLPCDHGGWQPNFNLLNELSGATDGRYANDFGNFCGGIVSLNNIVSAAADLTTRTIGVSGTLLDDVLGIQPEIDKLTAVDKTKFGGDPGLGLTMMHRLRDNSSNQVVVFDVSNLFYGNRIKPGSVVLTDPDLSGSDGKFGMVIKDDGRGGLYRADADSEHATWASLGTVFYDEGIMILKHPNLFFFGKRGFDVSFRGVQNVHVLTFNTYARSMQLISSSNPGFERNLANGDLFNEPDQDFVYITGINIHDENLNVIAKSTLAQPVVKRTGDKFMFKVRMDF